MFYVYGSTLFDTSVDFDAMVEDYFSHAYGDAWREVVEFLGKIGKAFDMDYMQGKKSANVAAGLYYNPAHAAALHSVKTICKEFMPTLEKYKNMPKRAQTVSVRLMIKYLEYLERLAKCMALKSVGADVEASDAFVELCREFGKYEVEIERYYDQHMMGASINRIFQKSTTFIHFD